jgi:hypothetical protein
MEVSWHPDNGVVILSLWQGPVCRATFRLPIEDTPRLVHELVEALSQGIQSPGPVVTAAGSESLLHRIRRRVRSEAAEIISLAERRRR